MGVETKLFSSKVSNKDSVKVLDKLHKDMEVNECKKVLKAWQMSQLPCITGK